MAENLELLETDLAELMTEYQMFKRGYEPEVNYTGGLAGDYAINLFPNIIAANQLFIHFMIDFRIKVWTPI